MLKNNTWITLCTVVLQRESIGWSTLRWRKTVWHKGTDICIYMHNTHAHSLKLSLAATLPLSVMHTHTQTHIHRLTQPWNPLRLGDLAKQLIHSAFDLFPISSLQSANWEKQKRRGDCCMSPRDQTKERPRDWQRMLVCVDGCWDVRLCIQVRSFVNG